MSGSPDPPLVCTQDPYGDSRLAHVYLEDSVPESRLTLIPRLPALIAGVTLGTVIATAALAPSANGAIIDQPVGTSTDAAALDPRVLGSYETGPFDESAAEIVAHHADTQRLFSVNAAAGDVTVLDIAEPAAPALLFALQTTGVQAADGTTVPEGAIANSVSACPDGLVVVAVESNVKTDAGWLIFFDAAGEGEALGAVRVGALPDMVTFTPCGAHAVVTNEGEPNDDYTVDPEGDIAVVNPRNPQRTRAGRGPDSKLPRLRSRGRTAGWRQDLRGGQ